MNNLHFEEPLPDKKGRLEVHVEAGQVEIRPYHGRAVIVDAEVENTIVTVTRQEHIVRIWAKTDRENSDSQDTSWLNRLFLAQSVKAHLVIQIPADCEIELRTITGQVLIADINAPLTARVTTGKMTLANLGGPIYAKLITGELRYEGALADATHRFETITGTLQLRLHQVPNAQLNASTLTGRLHCAFPLTGQKEKRFITGSKLQGTLGSGAGRIKAKVTTGNLTLEPV